MLILTDVSAGYGVEPVLHGVSFTLEKGKSLAIIGPNGSGKTTLLRCIAGLLPFTGTVTLDGAPVSGMPRKQIARRLALLSQLTQMYFQYSVYETVMMGRYAHIGGALARPSENDIKIAEDSMRSTGIYELRERSVGTLSGGQLQRVMLAKTFAQSPDIILLDEPTSHLDIRSQLELTENLKAWAAEGSRSVIGVLHDLTQAMSFCEHMLLMCEGRVTAHGDVIEVLRGEQLTRAYGVDVLKIMKASMSQWQGI